MYMSVTMEKQVKHEAPYASGEMTAKIKSIVECYLEQVAKAPVGGYDTVR